MWLHRQKVKVTYLLLPLSLAGTSGMVTKPWRVNFCTVQMGTTISSARTMAKIKKFVHRKQWVSAPKDGQAHLNVLSQA